MHKGMNTILIGKRGWVAAISELLTTLLQAWGNNQLLLPYCHMATKTIIQVSSTSGLLFLFSH